MNKERQIKAFINRSIKKGSPFSGEAELRSLIEIMSASEISKFWSYYYPIKAHSEATANVPHWKTKQHGKYFAAALINYVYYPKEKDKYGKYIIDKKDLVDHVVMHISNMINEDIQINLAFKKKTFLEKIPYYALVSTFIMLPVLLISSFLAENKFFKGVVVACVIQYGINILAYTIVRAILNSRQRAG